MKFKELQKVFDTYRLYKDRGVVRMLAASVIANQIATRASKTNKPVWIMFVAPPGGGKSDITDTIAKIEAVDPRTKEKTLLCEEVSDLTTASFASGMRSSDGETSLIKKINPEGGILLFKDFTTVLSKRFDDMTAIMSYLREIYDGHFSKRFGNGKTVSWEGNIGVIGSCTTIIYNELPKLSVMGDRLMMYQIQQPDRMEVLEKIWENEDAGVDGSDEMSEAMKGYVERVIDYINTNKKHVSSMTISSELRQEFARVANFVTYARSGVVWNFKKDTIQFVPDAEMPTRILKQFIALANAFMIMNMAEGHDAKLTKNDTGLIYKIAFDSIPNMRRQVIKIVAQFSLGATDQGIADVMGMQLAAVQMWLEELVALKVVDRLFDHSLRKYKYRIDDNNFLETIKTYEHVVPKEEELVSDDEGPGTEEDYGVSEW